MSTPNKTPKVLVIGSSGHKHVTCVAWESVHKINPVDFDIVLINVRSLTLESLKLLGPENAQKLRVNLSRLLRSSGRLVVLGARKSHPLPINRVYIDNYSWSPLNLGIEMEAGDTIEIRNNEFPKLFAHFSKWSFYYSTQRTIFSKEFLSVCGNVEETQYQSFVQEFIVNRYGQLLAGTIRFQVIPKAFYPAFAVGAFTLLPLIESLEEREAITLVLEDLLSLPQAPSQPNWAEHIQMPKVPDMTNQIMARETQISLLKKEIFEIDKQRAKIESFKRLLYSTGTDLEEIFAEAIKLCGGEIEEAKYSREEFLLSWRGHKHLVECKGVGKSMALTHVRQLIDYLLKFEEDEGKSGHGVLFSNPWRDTPLSERKRSDAFPSNVLERSQANNIAVIYSADFFFAFCRFLEGTLSGEKILERITCSTGLVDFSDL